MTIYRLPPIFYEDHVSRGLPSGLVKREGKTFVEVDLDAAAYADLLSDARHYAHPGQFDADYRSLVGSARSTVKALTRHLEVTA